MFSLTEQTAEITHLNTRKEKHGTESVLAIDIDITAEVTRDTLKQFAPALPEFLFDGDKLRFPQMEPIAWECRIKDASLVVTVARKKDGLAFNVNIKAAKIHGLEGGTVVLSFQAKTNPRPAQVGELSGLLGKKVVLDLVLNDLFSGQQQESAEPTQTTETTDKED